MKKIFFEFNRQKSIETILWVIKNFGGKVNKYHLLKIIFETDRNHLNKYGRPVTGDTFSARKLGTVPNNIYQIIQNNDDTNFFIYDAENHTMSSDSAPNLNKFSKSELEELKNIVDIYSKLSRDEVEERNHQETCWIKNKDNQNNIIPVEDMIINPEALEYALDYHSKDISL